ncbi:MAG: alkaline phosphatase family protein [Polyangia bacterium]
MSGLRRWGAWAVFVVSAASCAGASDTPESTETGALMAAPGSVAPARSGIEHVVVVMMENRSFDHLFGWVHGADGRQAGLSYPDRTGAMQPTHPLAPDFQGCAHPDPDHSFQGGRVEYDGGACDGWLRAGSNDEFAIGYYRQADLGFFGRAVPQWTAMDRYFAPIMAETYPNRIYQHAAQTDRLTNTTAISALPTIWDRLAAKGIEGRYYYSDVPFLALWGAKYVGISRPFASFLVDAVTGHLPQVAFVDPRFLDEESGTSGDDHPHGDVRNGEAFLNLVYTAVTRGPGWNHTVLVINYDEWGGFFDHVPPPTAPIPPADAAAGNTDGRLGFRTAALLVAPWAPAGAVSHEQFDHTSVLRMIEWRWGLEPLTVRDASANNLADALDFNSHRPRPPLLPVPPGPFGAPCVAPPPPPPGDVELASLAAVARTFGWQLPAVPTP